MEFEKLPKRVRVIIERVRGGQVLAKTFRNKETGGVETLYRFDPSGKKAPEKSSQAAIESGLLAPCGDGLFGEDTSQTWRAA